ncbi:MAG: hypothetical protein B7Z68_07000 [Acidobacteria bacterium 21-70-11]|nr:MAG: hypothetical protein B7Z68_07000 [Acidobacteria bacterium 21-70-11]
MDVPVREVIRPASIAEALAVLAAREDARPIAGGTDLMVQLRDGRRLAGCLVDLGRLGLAGIRRAGEAIEVGAATTMDAIAADAGIQRSFPALARAARQVGAWPIQCRATLGGNLANGSPAVVSAAGTRRLPIAEFLLGPGRTALAPGELVTSVHLPLGKLPPGDRAVERFVKVGPRREQVISVVSLAARAVIRPDGTLAVVRLALGSVAPTPVRALTAERTLAGRRPDVAARRDAARAVQHDIAPIDDVRAPARYRRIAAAVLLDRFLQEAARA